MTREEAIAILEVSKHMATSGRLYNQALDMAIEALKEQPTIPTFAESAEAYKAWTGEEMGKTSDAINEMNKEIIKDILKMMPTAYLLEALGVATFEELTEEADRPHGEWIKRGTKITCSHCKSAWSASFDTIIVGMKYCPNCGAKMGGDGE